MTDDLEAIKARFKPASDDLVSHLARTCLDRHNHDHPANGEDLFCLNLTSYMGERVGPLLVRLTEVVGERDMSRKDAELARLVLTLNGGGIDPNGYYAGTPGDRARDLLAAEVERDRLRSAIQRVLHRHDAIHTLCEADEFELRNALDPTYRPAAKEPTDHA